MRLILTLFLVILLMITIGCDNDNSQQLAWQREQVEHLQRQAEHNTATAKVLVEADAKARRELLAQQSQLQSQQAEVGRQRDRLETERKALASERQRAPVFAALVHSAGT